MSGGVPREHHFVPQFYLRYFSANGKQICMFNFERQRVIPLASIKHQCARRNFYGFLPELEKALSELEGAASATFRAMRASGRPPLPETEDWQHLLTFVLFQKLRTTGSGHLNDTMTDYLAKMLMEGRPEANGIDPDSFRVRNVHAVALPMSLALETLPFMTDLGLHLFINRTSREFVTSDDPVVMYNQYCEGIRYQGVTGWNCRGLQVFVPFSPSEMLMLYDSLVYRIGEARHGNPVTEINREADVASLNALQVLNSHENVYFRGTDQPRATEQQCRAWTSRRPKQKMVFVETERVPEEDGRSSSLLHSFEPLLPHKLEVSSISVRRDARRVSLYSRGNLYRQRHEPPSGSSSESIRPVRYAVKRIVRK